MERQNIIVLTYRGIPVSTWGSLTECCDVYGFPYRSMKEKPFPIVIDDLHTLYKVPFRRQDAEYV